MNFPIGTQSNYIRQYLLFFCFPNWSTVCVVGFAWRTAPQMTWSAHWALTPWSTSCCLSPLASQPTRTSSDWWPTHRTGWCTPEPPSWWWTRTSRYLLPCETRTWRECCSPRRRYGSPTRTAWRSEPSPTAKTEASSTRRPSSSTSPSLPTPTESTLNGAGQRCGDGLRPPRAAPLR